ncbi:enoyl-CoA hydratase/isomerase family protein [Pseudohyphozyma bogoriensis]|nr:enoyl-CoA hydratase/isomerase family protein [Pseudohyphozyma bogoriensis]
MTFPRTFPRGAATPLATVTRPTPKTYLLSMNNLPDNRLTPDYIQNSLLPALDDIEHDFWAAWHKGDREAALVITGESKHKFFSNGLELGLAAQCPHFFRDVYYRLLTKVLTFPMPTVAALNGHTFAGGFALGQACDWRVIKAERAWSCMNELDFGANLPSGMAGLLQAKLSPTTLRTVMLQAHRFTAPEALAAGIVDEVVAGDGAAVIKRAVEIAEANVKHSASGALPHMKETIWSSAVKALKADDNFGATSEELNAKRFKELQAAAVTAKL